MQPSGTEATSERLKSDVLQLANACIRCTTWSMEAVLLIGIQGSGKSTFYRERFFDTHVRVSLDLLRTYHRERRLLELCLETRQPFVVDKTNATVAQRERYIRLARQVGFRVIGYFFEPDPARAAEWNQRRPRPIPLPGLFGTLKHLQRPRLAEGFDELHQVLIDPLSDFIVRDHAEDDAAQAAPRAMPSHPNSGTGLDDMDEDVSF